MKKKKWREVKNAVVMVIVMAAMMSTATYAWFTLTSNATVTGMQMTAGGSSGLKVSKTGEEGTFADAVDLMPAADENGEIPANQIINQLTVGDATDGVFPVELYKPVYTGEEVTGVELITREADFPEYAAKYTYYLKTETGQAETVGIVTSAMPEFDVTTGLNDNNMPYVEGSFVRATEDDDNSAVYAVRIGLVVTNAEGTREMYVYEPNADQNITGDKANASGDAAYAAYDPTVRSSVDGTITVGGTANTSEALFTVSETGTQVDMYVWLEGTDNDCVNQIKADEIEAQIQFTIVE